MQNVTTREFRDSTKSIVDVTNRLIAAKALSQAEEAYLLSAMNRLLAAYDSYKTRNPIETPAPAAPAVAAPSHLRLVA